LRTGTRRNHRSTASSDRRHDGNIITIFDGCRVFLQIADILVIQINIDKSPQFSVLVVEMPAQVGMLRDQAGKSLGYGSTLNVDSGVFSSVLAKRSWDVNLAHTLLMMPQEAGRFIWHLWVVGTPVRLDS
jgi:hypothetical protein